jgi:hypothetical protein
MVQVGATASGTNGHAASPARPGNNAKFKGQNQAERKAQRQAQRQAERQAPPQGRRAHLQTMVAPPPLITSMGGPLRSSHRPAPMAPRPGKGQE